MSELSVTIRKLLKAKNLTQKVLAEKMGITPASVNQWLTGSSRPDNRRLYQLAQVLGVSVDELLADNTVLLTTGQRGFSLTGTATSIRVPFSELYKLLPFLSIAGQANLSLMNPDNCLTNPIAESYPVFMPSLAYNEKQLVIEMNGDSMEPTILRESLVLAERIDQDKIADESGGIYALVYGACRFTVRRIKTNELAQTGRLTLWAENEKYGQLSIKQDEIFCMWKVLEKVKEIVT